MKYLLIMFNILFVLGCGGSGSGSSNPPVVVDDPIGLSRFAILNASNYAIFVECETNGYSDCDQTRIEAGESQVLGEYAEFGGSPPPENVFLSVTISYDPGGGAIIYSHELTNEQWSISDGDSEIVSHGATVVDSDLL